MNSQLNVILSPEPIPGTLVCLMGVSRVQGWNCVQKEGEPVWRVHITYRTSGPMPWVTRALPRNEVGEEEFVFGATYRCLLSDWAAEEILEPKGATKVHSKQNRAQRHAWDLSVYVCSCLLMSVRTMFIMWQNTKNPKSRSNYPECTSDICKCTHLQPVTWLKRLGQENHEFTAKLGYRARPLNQKKTKSEKWVCISLAQFFLRN